MIAKNDASCSATQSDKLAASMLNKKEQATQPPSALCKIHCCVLSIVSTLLLFLLLFAAARLSIVSGSGNEQLFVRIGDQPSVPVLVDLLQSLPLSPYLLGVNTFPAVGTSSVDQAYSGFMNYDLPITAGLKDAHIKLLRFPGGSWGEDHYLSFDQLNAFSTLLSQIGADGMIQTRLSSTIDGKFTNLTDITARANLAGRWVDYMNNPHSAQRIGKYAHASFHSIKFWTVGNEPDLLINPDTKKPFTVAEYIKAFIQYSLAMHQSDPTIQVFGPEISQFNGPGAGPTDARGQLWMESFLKGISAYEHAHPRLKFHLLDGISFHRYPLTDKYQDVSPLINSSDEWNFLLPLHDLVKRILGRDVPIAVTEINTNPTKKVLSPGLGALWWAKTLGTLMYQRVDYVAFFSAEGVDTPYPLFTTDGPRPTPMFRVMQLFSHLQHNLIPLHIQQKSISVYATQDDRHQTVSLLFINESQTTQHAQVSTGKALFTISSWQSLDISLVGYSIVLLTLHRGGGVEAYSYSASPSDYPNTAPLIYTVCGQRGEAPANNIPC